MFVLSPTLTKLLPSKSVNFSNPENAGNNGNVTGLRGGYFAANFAIY